MEELRAYAKINVGLEVTGRRPDGYHDLVSLMQTVSLYDSVCAEADPDSRDWTLDCSDPMLETADNLVLRACGLMQQKYGIGGGRVWLEKHIPAAGGLGGGSSDAATMLVAINRLYRLGLSLDKLMDVAAEIGSDVPFFLSSGTALVEGRGERVSPIRAADVPKLYETTFVLLTPPVALPSNKTAALYRALVPQQDWGDGTCTRELVARLRTGAALDSALLRTSFARPLFALVPDILPYVQRLHEAGAQRVFVSGSGPTLFALFARQADAEQVYASVADMPGAYLAQPVQTEWADTLSE